MSYQNYETNCTPNNLPAVLTLSNQELSDLYSSYGNPQGYLENGYYCEIVNDDLPAITLDNGLKVVNFSSPHSFTFDDNKVLPACNVGRMQSFSLKMEDKKVDAGAFTALYKKFVLTDSIMEELDRIIVQGVDLIIVPFPMLAELAKLETAMPYSQMCCTASLDRATKVCSSSEFCFL